MGRRNQPVVVSEEDRSQLEAIAKSRSLPHGLVTRARIVLHSADGCGSNEVAQLCGVSAQTVSHWRRRFRSLGVAGLHDELKSGRPRRIEDEQVAELVRKVLEGAMARRHNAARRRKTQRIVQVICGTPH